MSEPGPRLVHSIDRFQDGQREHDEHDDAGNESERDDAPAESDNHGTHLTRIAHNPTEARELNAQWLGW